MIYALVSISSTRHYMHAVDQQLNRNLAANLVADRKLVTAGRINQAALKETFQEYMVINPSIEIYLLDRDGTILSYSADPKLVKRRRVSLQPIEAFLRGAEDFPLLGDDPRSHNGHKPFSVTPVPSAKDVQGYLYVVLRGQQYDNVENLVKESFIIRQSVWALAGSLVFGLLAGLLLFHFLTRRLYRLTSLMDEFRQSGFTRFTPFAGAEHGGDELDQLGVTFNEMAARMTAQLEQLKQQDHLRRELVANISHDLRTPLAILHGYLETLKLKAATLSPEERDTYLQSALRNSDYLSTLVADLFELAKLDAAETRPQREAFAPGELVQDVLQKFQLKAKDLDVRLEMECPDGLQFVYADIALIERVLENLVSNALRHTPAGGSIVVKLAPEGSGVAVAVTDTGSGIPDKDLPHVFERFYQSSKPSQDKDHSGLGLAIAKRILELHDSKLAVRSRVGHGTTFRFTLRGQV